MNEFLSTLLQVVIIAAVPICADAAINGIRAAVQYLASKSESEISKKYLTDVADAISTAVTYTSQTYVDALKASGNFTKENQEEALQKAVDQATKLLTVEARNFLEKAYGDLNAYLISKIEAEVRVQKQQINTIMPGEPFTAELKESSDVTTVAAATAAATAAVVVQSTIPQATPISAPNRPKEGTEAPVV